MTGCLESVFLTVLRMSASASVVVAVVLAVRVLLRKAPKSLSYALWAAVGFRLCVPLSFRSAISIFRIFDIFRRSAETTAHSASSDTAASAVSLSDTVGMLPAAPYTAQTGTNAAAQISADRGISAMTVLAVVWLCIAIAITVLLTARYAAMKRSVRTAVRVGGNVYASENIRSPFVLGVLRPRVYIPYGLTREQTRCMIMHERRHIRRGDNIVRLAAAYVCAAHWFNPLAWLSFRMMCLDMEMSCDEYVAERMGARKQYSLALLSIAENKMTRAFSEPVGFGGSDVKERITNVLTFRKPSKLIMIISILAAALVLTACVSDPISQVYVASDGDSANTSDTAEADAKTWSEADFPDVLAEYSTAYDPGNAERAGNLALCCDIINGTVLEPQQVFSFNDTVGERTAERGFMHAAVGFSEPTAERYGGGVSQVSSTLFYCAVRADLELVERHGHENTVAYMEDENGMQCCGSDAMVCLDSANGVDIDMRFSNSKERPVLVECSARGGRVTFRLRGTWDGRTAEYRYLEKEAVAYGVKYLPKEDGRRDTPGMIGRTITTYRVRFCQQTPNVGMREELERFPEFETVYAPLPQVRYVDAPPEGCEFGVVYPADI